MNNYKMTVTETVTRHYFIEAESEHHARNWRGEVTDMKEVWCETDDIEDIEEYN
jgi:hypothetical protein